MGAMDYDEFQEQYLKHFTLSQLNAVKAVEGAVLLLAVPGSGKTTVLVARLGYMTRCLGIEPESILTMTYTVAATREMRRRFAALFGQETADRMEFRTINGLSAKIIQYYERNFGKDKAFRLIDSESELNKIAAQIYCDVTGEKYAPQSTVKDIRTGITYAKNMMLADDEIRGVDVGVEKFPQIYARYCAYLKENRLMDYDDQMTYALLFLQKVPSLLEHFQNTFQYICVDEAQDTSKIQHEIIKLLASKSGNLFMVGDEDQSIYGFRAAYPDALMRFEEDHPGAKVLLIEDNFRSTPEIIALANAFVSKNKFRREKTICPTKATGKAVKIISALNRETQFDYLFHEARNVQKETAILYRNNESSLPLIDLFERNGVAYSCRSFDASFFSHRILNDIRSIVRFAKNPTDEETFMQIYYKLGLPISKAAARFACRASRGTGDNILKSLLSFQELSPSTREGIIDRCFVLPTVLTAGAERALDLIQNELQYRKYAEKNNLDMGKFSVLRFLARNEPDIEGLLRRLDELQAILQDSKSMGESLLTLSTVHSSKGLEYERVILLDIIDGILPAKPAGSCKTEEEIRNYQEDRRLFYVAMTRAKSELYLFSCLDSPASFTREAQAALPKKIVHSKDIFAFLHENLLSKNYFDKEDGQGQIIAQCDDSFLIKYSGGKTELLTFLQMAQRRDTSVKYAPAKPPKPEKSKSSALVAETVAEPQEFKAGKRVTHKTFGPGRITAITGTGTKAIATVKFEKFDDLKRFVLQDTVKKKLLHVVK